jgi:hypothetical protein
MHGSGTHAHQHVAIPTAGHSISSTLRRSGDSYTSWTIAFASGRRKDWTASCDLKSRLMAEPRRCPDVDLQGAVWEERPGSDREGPVRPVSEETPHQRKLATREGSRMKSALAIDGTLPTRIQCTGTAQSQGVLFVDGRSWWRLWGKVPRPRCEESVKLRECAEAWCRYWIYDYERYWRTRKPLFMIGVTLAIGFSGILRCWWSRSGRSLF